jgi:hypothetical protein
MAKSKRRNTPQQNAAQAERTKRNKERRAKQAALAAKDPKRAERLLKRLEKKNAKRAARYKPGRAFSGPNHVVKDDTFIILFKESKKLFDGLKIDGASNGERDLSVLPAEHRYGQLGNLITEGAVDFITKANKRWHIGLSEFSFYIPSKKAS